MRSWKRQRRIVALHLVAAGEVLPPSAQGRWSRVIVLLKRPRADLPLRHSTPVVDRLP
jgi:hypothetical protein